MWVVKDDTLVLLRYFLRIIQEGRNEWEREREIKQVNVGGSL